MTTKDLLVEETISRHHETWSAIEELTREAITAGEAVSGTCISLMHSVGMTDPYEIERYRSRVQNADKWKAEAGTILDREKLEKKIADAEAKRQKELPGLQGELRTVVEKLQRKIDALNGAVDRSQADLARRNDAAEKLRGERVLPPHIWLRYNARRADINWQFHDVSQAEANVRASEGRLELIANLETRGSARLDLPGGNRYLDFAKNKGLGSMSESLGFVLDQSKVKTLKAETEKVLADARKVIEERGPLREQAIEEAESLRDYYIE